MLVKAELPSICYFSPCDQHCWALVLPCFVNVNATANDEDALWQETLLALNNKQFFAPQMPSIHTSLVNP